jgi:hypothetical protein
LTRDFFEFILKEYLQSDRRFLWSKLLAIPKGMRTAAFVVIA